jgi:uncharacterized protein (UPF0276 family)
LGAPAEGPRLGIGIGYSSAIEPLLEREPDLIDVLEIEPQTTWIKTGDRYLPNEEALRHLERLPGRKLIHSVAAPVGGTVRPEPAQVALLRDAVERFQAPWLSEHLSFNQTPDFATGFFLPPRQTMHGVRVATAGIRDLQTALPVPVAVETGVNYLRPRRDELADGEFVARVIEAADCGLLLDLHNVFANERNGRQPLDAFLEQLPLERVWEVHLAGGMEAEGFWLDSHSGAIPDALCGIAERVIPRLPNLGAIIFEIFPSFVPLVGLDLIREELARLRDLWRLRPRERRPQVPRIRLSSESCDTVPPEAWERALGKLVTGQAVDDEIGAELARDRAVSLVGGLVCEFRASMIVAVLPLTSRLLILALGAQASRVVFQDYWSRTPPRMFASLEAEAFGRYLGALELKVPQLAAVLSFERAVLATLVDGQRRVVPFEFEPLPLLRGLAEGRLPEKAGQAGAYEIELTPDGLADLKGRRLDDADAVFQFH